MSDLNREINTLRPAGEAGAVATGMAPVRVGGTIKTPMKVRDLKPAYPPDALAAKVSGIVILEITIGTDGSVTDAKVLRGQPLLNDAALGAVRQWQYAPTLLNGVPVPVIMTATVTFTAY